MTDVTIDADLLFFALGDKANGGEVFTPVT